MVNYGWGSTRTAPLLWEFLFSLLEDKDCVHLIKWIDKSKRSFKIINSAYVASLWGDVKGRPKMNQNKLRRAIRLYYKRGIMKKVKGQRGGYKFENLPYDPIIETNMELFEQLLKFKEQRKDDTETAQDNWLTNNTMYSCEMLIKKGTSDINLDMCTPYESQDIKTFYSDITKESTAQNTLQTVDCSDTAQNNWLTNNAALYSSKMLIKKETSDINVDLCTTYESQDIKTSYSDITTESTAQRTLQTVDSSDSMPMDMIQLYLFSETNRDIFPENILDIEINAKLPFYDTEIDERKLLDEINIEYFI